ncbi:unnamed protein product, partial [Sphacelaria rigidula]
GPDGICHELAAAAESGWDFSSRWGDGGRRDALAASAASAASYLVVLEEMEGGMGATGVAGGGSSEDESFCLCDTATTAVVPADLNAFMHRAELNIARLHHAHHARTRENTNSSSRGRRSSSSASTTTNATPPPPPALLTLDEIQRRYLSRDRRVYGSSSGFVTLDCLPPEIVDRTYSDDCESSSEAGVGVTAGGFGLGSDVRAVVRSRGALCQKAMLLLAAARARAKAIEQTMWDDDQALWRDLLLPTGGQSTSITPACYIPLWAGLPWPRAQDGASGRESAGARLARSVASLRSSGLVQAGGVCTSLQ